MGSTVDMSWTERGGAREAVVALAGSARAAGRRAVVTGRWLADTVVETAPRVPVRDSATLSVHHDGLEGAPLAGSLIRSAGRVSAGVAAAAGALIAAQQVSVAGLVLVPFELAAATVLIVLVELKLVAELHQVAGRELPGGPVDRSRAVLMSWMSGRAAPADRVVTVRGDLLGRAGRRQLVRELRSRYVRNLWSLGPMLTGAAMAGHLSRRSTRAVGRRVARDLGIRP